MTIQSDINARYSRLAPSVRRVADIILSDPHVVLRSNLAELASLASTSQPTIVRLCQLLDLRGYVELKVALAFELGWEHRRRAHLKGADSSGRYVVGGESIEEIIASTALIETISVEESLGNIDLETLRLAADALHRAERIFTYGTGSSGSCGEDLQRRVLRLGYPMQPLHSSEEAMVTASYMNERHVLIIFSHSGETREVLRVAEMAKQSGARIIAVTNNRESSISKLGNFQIETKVRETSLRSAGIGARTAQSLVSDCLYMALAHKDIEGAHTSLARTDEIMQSFRE